MTEWRIIDIQLWESVTCVGLMLTANSMTDSLTKNLQSIKGLINRVSVNCKLQSLSPWSHYEDEQIGKNTITLLISGGEYVSKDCI